MATRLYRTLTFQGLVVGVPASLPHGINVDDQPQVPHFVTPEVGGYALTADATNVTVTRLPGAPATVDVWVELLHTYLRAFNADADLSIKPFVLDPGSAIATSSPSNALIYRPGGPDNGPVVFNSWASLYAQLLVMRAQSNNSGLYEICFDASVVSPCVVPAGTYAMMGCVWRGFGAGASDSVQLADGVVLQNLYEYQNNLIVTSLSNTTPPVVCAHLEVYQFVSAAIFAGGTAPYFSGASLTAGQAVTFRADRVSNIGSGGANDVINFPVVGSICQLSLGTQSAANNNALDIVAGATLQVFYRSTSASIGGTQPAMLGTLSVTDLVVDRWRTRTLAGGGAAAFGDQIGTTPAGGGSVITLPTITAFSAGLPVSIKRLNAANALTITPAGGQTIDGAASLTLSGLQGVILCPDGPVPAGTNWRILAAFSDTGVFGMNFQSVSTPGRTTTTLATFQTKTTLVTPALTGTFRVMATANIDSILSMQARLQNVTDAVQVGDTGEYSPLTSGDSIAWVAAGDVVFAGVAKTFEIQWRDTPPGGQTAGISDARIEFWRVA